MPNILSKRWVHYSYSTFRGRFFLNYTCELIQMCFYWRVCEPCQRAEDEAQAREVSRQQELEAERQRQAELQERQRERQQLSAFEEMIRRQELEKERQRIVQEFSVPVSPTSPRDLLVPDVPGPPQASFSPLTPPGGTPNHVSPSSGLPAFDRSLKPSVPVSAGHSESSQFALPYSSLHICGGTITLLSCH